jgi:hypothetical protein
LAVEPHVGLADLDGRGFEVPLGRWGFVRFGQRDEGAAAELFGDDGELLAGVGEGAGGGVVAEEEGDVAELGGDGGGGGCGHETAPVGVVAVGTMAMWRAGRST